MKKPLLWLTDKALKVEFSVTFYRWQFIGGGKIQDVFCNSSAQLCC
ncbi:hypothetical protein [Lacimicrobium alkaliphilum]|nr:hypothetical protein [Lacimicrobium alkaliphilum]